MNTYRALGILLALLLAVAGCGTADIDTTATQTETAALTAPVQINCGGGAVSPFSADQYFSGGNTYASGNAVATSGVANAAPAAVYQTERFGNHSYTFGGLTAGSAYTVRLHFAEIWFTATGQRVFNVSINGAQVLANFDIVAAAGGANKAVVRDFAVNADGSAQIVVQYTSVVDNAKASGIEILSTASGTAPTITTQPASQTVTAGQTATFSVAASGTAPLSYQWQKNGSNVSGATGASYTTPATMPADSGSTFRVIVSNSSGSVTSNAATLTVNASGGSLPSPWVDQDIGSVGLAGSASYSTGTFTVKASGDDIWNGADAFHYVYQPLSGDGTIVARVTAVQNTDAWAKAGVMIRESLAANSTFADVILSSSNGTRLQSRTTTGGSATETAGPAGIAPYWVKLARAGNVFTGSVSTNGNTWTTVGQITISMASSAYVGLAVTAHNNTLLNTSTFDSVAVSTGSSPTAPTITTQPASQTVTVGQTATFSVSASGTAPLSYQWQKNGSNISGATSASYTTPATTTADSGSTFRVIVTNSAGSATSNNATLTVNSGSGSTAIAINSGGGAVGSFVGDTDFSGGSAYSTTTAVSTTGVTSPAPAAVYQSERFGAFTYTIPGLTAGASYKVRLHFAEIYWSNTGQRIFNVAINGSTVLPSFDIVAAAGGSFKAVVREFTVAASSSGTITIAYAQGSADQPKSSGIEVLSAGGSSNQAPTVASAASASPNPTGGTTTNLSVLGADDSGENNLTYTWAATGTPPAAVSFSANGTNAAKSTTATFAKAGTYTLAATIADGGGLTVASSVNVTVSQTLTSIAVSPASATVATGGTQQFAASALDQFGSAISSQPAFTWSVNGGGTISSSGLFSAQSTGSFTVSASSGGKTGSASVTVTTGTGVTYATDFNLTESPISEGGAWKHLGLDWTLAKTASGIAFGTQTGTGGYDDSYAYLSGFPADQSGTGIIYKAAGLDPSCTHEVEILLRWGDAAHDAHGYECNLAWDGAYAQIVRWNGPVGNFTYLASGSVPGGVHDGDTLSASIVGNLIRLLVNGVEIARATDSTFTTGNPGMGFWLGGACGGNNLYGFTRYTASSL